MRKNKKALQRDVDLYSFGFYIGEIKACMDILHCIQCGEIWSPTGDEKPSQCGKCKSRNWNEYPLDFDPDKCECLLCLLRYSYLLKHNKPIPFMKRKKRDYVGHATPHHRYVEEMIS